MKNQSGGVGKKHETVKQTICCFASFRIFKIWMWARHQVFGPYISIYLINALMGKRKKLKYKKKFEILQQKIALILRKDPSVVVFIKKSSFCVPNIDFKLFNGFSTFLSLFMTHFFSNFHSSVSILPQYILSEMKAVFGGQNLLFPN